MRSIYTKTLYQKRFMMLGWLMGITGVVFLTMSVYNSFSSGAIGDSLQNLPPALQKLAGDALSFKTVGGYISQQVFALRVPVLLIILSIAIFVSLSGGEEQQGLAESQLTLPIGRAKLLLHKLAAALTVITVASMGALLGIQFGLIVIGHSYSLLDVLPHLLNCMLIAICYGLVGFMVAAASGRRGLALGAASGLAFLGFLINSMASSVELFATLDRFTLFHYYQIAGGYNWSYISLLAGLALLLIIVGITAFRLRDIRAR